MSRRRNLVAFAYASAGLYLGAMLFGGGFNALPVWGKVLAWLPYFALWSLGGTTLHKLSRKDPTP